LDFLLPRFRATKFPNRSLFLALGALFFLKDTIHWQQVDVFGYWIRHVGFLSILFWDKEIKAQSWVGFAIVQIACSGVVYVCVITKSLCSNALAPSKFY